MPPLIGVRAMNETRVYEIRIEENLPSHWSDWFEGLVIDHHPGGQTRLRGALPDQAALYGVLTKIQALNLTLVHVSSSSSQVGSTEKQYGKE